MKKKPARRAALIPCRHQHPSMLLRLIGKREFVMSHLSTSQDSKEHFPRKRPFIIGVCGGTGSGKTTVSRSIQATVGPEVIAYLEHDSYYKDHSHLSPEDRARANYDHPDSLDTALLIRHLHALCRWEAIEMPIYDFATHSRSNRTYHIEA